MNSNLHFTFIEVIKEVGMYSVQHKKVEVDGLQVFYREVGDINKPTLLLLHGFPSSSHMYRDLIPLLSKDFHLVAPDFPGFGQTDCPSNKIFKYTFEDLADVMTKFTEALNLDRFAIYVFDYGSPVGLRMAVKNPERITAVISQNGNAYKEGLSEGWNPIRKYWESPNQANREALRAMLTLETTHWQYTHGVSQPEYISPDGYTLDDHYINRPGNDEIQLDLFLDYASNVEMYPKFQEFFKTYQPPFLAVWGKNDPFFLPAGAEAFKRDLPDAEIIFLDTGHFALETHANEIAFYIKRFFSRVETQSK
jgi:pimeloyl-ACP methyl ester carboxylesterase